MQDKRQLHRDHGGCVEHHTEGGRVLAQEGITRPARAGKSDGHPADLFKQDAEVALALVSGLLSRYPFSFSDEGAEEE
jgi:hypothetical protein